jgi:hypothetical protein
MSVECGYGEAYDEAGILATGQLILLLLYCYISEIPI